MATARRPDPTVAPRRPNMGHAEKETLVIRQPERRRSNPEVSSLEIRNLGSFVASSKAQNDLSPCGGIAPQKRISRRFSGFSHRVIAATVGPTWPSHTPPRRHDGGHHACASGRKDQAWCGVGVPFRGTRWCFPSVGQVVLRAWRTRFNLQSRGRDAWQFPVPEQWRRPCPVRPRSRSRCE